MKISLIGFLLAAAPFSYALAKKELIHGIVDISVIANCVGESGAKIEGHCDFEVDDSRRRHLRNLPSSKDEDAGFYVAFTDCDLEDESDNEYYFKDGIIAVEDMEWEDSDENGDNYDTIVRKISGDVSIENESGTIVASGTKEIQVTIIEDPDTGDESVQSMDKVELVWHQDPDDCLEMRAVDLNLVPQQYLHEEESGGGSRD
jgi:hypothetical protein